ncbi:FANCI helical domain 2-domain-containing protein [Baffinella frigidus]|nr:FANCI helical domain 2-domain-containing protein [Cryptophyta sp. CCMP2293]
MPWEALEYLGFMSSATAVSLIAALEPVLVLHPSLQDYLVIVLRKSIFSREPEARMVALNGFLFLAEQSSSSSRGGGSSSTGGAGRAGVAPDPLGLEIIGQLRRCMVQQVEMRERLYDGLCQVAASKPKLIDSIISALLPNLQRCWDDGRSQLSVDKCIDDKGNITEPIPKLLRAVARCVYLAGGSSSSKSRAAGDVHPELVTRSRSILDKCVEWILTCAVEDFELDKETDFQGDDGVKFSSLAKLAIGLHEVLLEYLVLCTDLNPGTVRNKVFVIANKLEEITALVRVNTKGAGLGGVKGCGKNRKTSPEETLLTLDVSLKVLAMGGCDGKVEGVDSDVCTTIFAKSSLIGQILTTVNHQIEQLRDAPGTCFDAEFPKLKQMGALLIRQYLSECHEDRSFSFTVAAAGGKKGSDKSKTVVKKLSLLALKALETCMLTVCTNLGKEKVSELAEAVAAEMTDQSVVELPEEMDAAERHVAKCALNFQALLKDVLPQVDQSDAPLLSAPMLIINIGTALRDSLSLDSQGVLLGWTKDICTDQPNVVESPVFVKVLVQSYLHLAVADEGVAMLATAITLAEDVCVVLPQNSDEASQAEMQIAAHGIVSEDSVGGVMSPVADLVKATCEEVEWCCAYLDQLTASTSWIGDDSDHPQRVSAIKDINSVEDAALKRVRAVVDVMIPLSKVTSQDNGEPVLEALTRVYRSADFLAGRVLASKNLRKLFTSLMHRIGDDLNPVMYLAITSFADCDDEIKKGNRSKVVKESRLIPTLIFYVEKVEACLLKIQKIPNSVDFMRHFKRSTARDFNVKNFDKISEDAVKEGGAKKKGKGKGKRDKDDADENLSSAQPSAKKPKRA